ncbi:RING finger and CHY zinc finger domain-containing protein 1 [Pelomyxa schiedti]|nr:RING finger and CHY zinc finger domain-containing protein 1 [Pelomyxa schiedti]
MSAAEPRGCRHYRRNCELLAPCCGNWVSCRFCHNEGVADGTMMTRAGRSCGVEEMDRRAVKRVRCLLCRTEQPPTRTCQSCSNDFACYWCPCLPYMLRVNVYIYESMQYIGMRTQSSLCMLKENAEKRTLLLPNVWP